MCDMHMCACMLICVNILWAPCACEVVCFCEYVLECFCMCICVYIVGIMYIEGVACVYGRVLSFGSECRSVNVYARDVCILYLSSTPTPVGATRAEPPKKAPGRGEGGCTRQEEKVSRPGEFRAQPAWGSQRGIAPQRTPVRRAAAGQVGCQLGADFCGWLFRLWWSSGSSGIRRVGGTTKPVGDRESGRLQGGLESGLGSSWEKQCTNGQQCPFPPPPVGDITGGVGLELGPPSWFYNPF